MPLPDTPTGRAVGQLLASLRTRRAAVRSNKQNNPAPSLPNMRARMVDAEKLLLVHSALLAQLIDPADGDLTDDGA